MSAQNLDDVARLAVLRGLLANDEKAVARWEARVVGAMKYLAEAEMELAKATQHRDTTLRTVKIYEDRLELSEPVQYELLAA